jgi:hypothetical protein
MRYTAGIAPVCTEFPGTHWYQKELFHFDQPILNGKQHQAYLRLDGEF